ncbi:MAG TPA: hypothetical protein VJN43_02835 [Bryobacteraceae bacterium]|nr:hypothetical protein [Bryobacteraceae bacterium]
MEGISRAGALPVPAAAQARSKDDPAKVEHAAREFESLLIAQLLKSMREAGSEGWLGTGSDQAGGHAMELAEEQLAQAVAHQGGLGLATLVVAGLHRAADARGAAKADASPAVQKNLP